MVPRFPGQYPDEKILLATRRHWLVMIIWSLRSLVFAALAFLAYILLREYVPDLFSPAYARLTATFFIIAAMAIWIDFFLIWTDYYLDIWIVTSYRVIDVQQRGLFNRVVSEQNLERIQDVSASTAGLMPTLMNYGRVNIQTAGSSERFQFEQVPRPNKIKKMILDLAHHAGEKVEIIKGNPQEGYQTYAGQAVPPYPPAKGDKKKNKPEEDSIM